jgi:hypothetical protein
MGAWGYGPLDNDGAQDWLQKDLAKVLDKHLKSNNPTVVFAAMGVTAKLDMGRKVNRHALVKAAKTMLADDASDWKSETARKAAVRRTLVKLEQQSGMDLRYF